MPTYEFRVSDADGLWGDLRIAAESEAEARRLCESHLENYEDVDLPAVLTLFRVTEVNDEQKRKIPKNR